MQEIVLVSGGIDSTILAFQKPNARKVFFNYGQIYVNQERNALKKIFKDDFIEIDISHGSLGKDIFVPNRNLTFASVVATLFNPDYIYIAGLKDDNVVDKTEQAFKEMSNIISNFSNKRIRIISPYWNLTKGEIIEEFIKQNKNAEEILLNTYSCYNGVEGGCGNCPACFRKFVALKSNNIDFKRPSESIIKEYLKKIHKYDRNRIARTFIALKSIKKIQAVDIDGVLCEENKRMEDKQPLFENIDKINKLDGYIILYTSRLESDREFTEYFLAKNNIKYDALIMEKIPYDNLIDDKVTNIKEMM